MKPHVPRMPCFTPRSSLASGSSERLPQSSPDILRATATWCEPAVDLLSALFDLCRLARSEENVYFTHSGIATESARTVKREQRLGCLSQQLTGVAPPPHSSPRAGVCPHGERCALSHTDEKSLCCVVGVLRQDLSGGPKKTKPLISNPKPSLLLFSY